MRAMRAVRFGSYWMAAPLPGTPSLSRLKSMMRRRRLDPPPRWRTVTRPCWLRPAFCFFGASSRRSGFLFVISSNVKPVMPRRPGEVGLNCFVGIGRPVLLDPLEDLDRIALCEGDDRFLPVGCSRNAPAHPPALAVHVHSIYLRHMHVERRLDRIADLLLVRAPVDGGGVLLLAGQAGGFFGG